MLPIPIAIGLESGVVLRGHEWPADGPPVLLIHDQGEDLDVWRPLPTYLAANEFRVIAAELRGHGLSDGEADPSTTVEDLQELVMRVHGAFGPVALVCHGSVSLAAFRIDASHGAPVHVVVSPVSMGEAIDWSTSTSALRLLVVGTLDQASKRYIDEIYPLIRGQKLLVTSATDAAGPRLLFDQPNLLEHTTTFLQRYLRPAHAEWQTHAQESPPAPPLDPAIEAQDEASTEKG